jgi:hypothetical protein
MRYRIRAIFIGLLLGATLYFVPFVFPFLFLLFFIFFLSRIFFGRPWRRAGYGPCWGYPYRGNRFQDIVPIDGQGGYHSRNSGEKEKKIIIH